jgi:ribonuclease J
MLKTNRNRQKQSRNDNGIRKENLKKLKIIFLGGIGEIGKNMTALEYGSDIIIIDAGLAFPNETLPGIDYVLPDLTYLKENKNKIRAILLTHGHEDHIGGLAYALREFDVPVYGTKLTLALAESRLKEHKINNPKLNSVKGGSRIKAGCFEIEFISVCHSIAGSVALNIGTPMGAVFITGDFKIDFTPIGSEKADLARIAEIGKKGVLVMLADSTNAEREGYTMSERTVGETFNQLFGANTDRRIIVSTFASNVHRIQQILDVSRKYGRKVAFSGRSMLKVLEAATKIGELVYDKERLVDIEKISNIADRNLTIISTGSQGEVMSALARMATGSFNKVNIGPNDTVIISASPIPGNERMIYNVINNLYKKGANVIYSMLEKVHVSGHACQEELKLIHSLVKPRFFIPVHGEHRHLLQHKNIALSMGQNENTIVIAENGNVIEVTKHSIRKGGSVPSGSLLVDGLGIEDIDSIILRDRKRIAEDGIIVAVIGLNEDNGEITAGPEIISRGFMSKDPESFNESIKQVVLATLNSLELKTMPLSEIQNIVRKDLRNYIFKKAKASPMVIPFIISQ